jgi:transposase-like protein
MSNTLWREAMRRKRRNHSPEFKAKVALAAIQGNLTMAELVKKFDVHANQITGWKKQLLSNATDVFGKGAQKAEASAEAIEQLHAKIGRLTMENDFSYGHFLQAGRVHAQPDVQAVASAWSESSGNAATGILPTMDQARIRGLVTALHTSVAGLPRS